MAGRALNAEIITIGSEILAGHIVDSNTAFIGRHLAGCGVKVDYATSIADTEDKIHEALTLAVSRAKVIIITGGLGPTDDDITRSSIAAFFHRDLVFHRATFNRIKRQFARMRYPMTPTNRVQALVPRGAEVMENLVGNAAGFVIRHRSHYCFVMPGVPREMEHMMTRSVVPYLRRLTGKETIPTRVIRTTNIGESTMFDIVKHLAIPKAVTVSYLPAYTGVTLRVTVPTNSHRAQLNRAVRLLRGALADYIYSYKGEELEKVVGQLLKDKKMTLAVAESCTGGLIGNRLTDVPGSSAYFILGAITYSNEAKHRILGVSTGLLTKHGAVSEPVVQAMARGVRKKADADLAAAVSGIAGPGGGSMENPVGTVCIGFADKKRAWSTTCHFRGERQRIKDRSAQATLYGLYQYLIKNGQ